MQHLLTDDDADVCSVRAGSWAKHHQIQALGLIEGVMGEVGMLEQFVRPQRRDMSAKEV
jgi:hypothetical protein